MLDGQAGRRFYLAVLNPHLRAKQARNCDPTYANGSGARQPLSTILHLSRNGAVTFNMYYDHPPSHAEAKKHGIPGKVFAAFQSSFHYH